ncbi:rhoGAP domain-containing protein [Sarocladium implicatum]|nr:rhoGAP domain-containing protein [Sarocladium implicatum]
MASVVDEYLDSRSQDGDGDGDDVFPCKGCGDILEEGKAFELAGNRWHLDCFRCNTCGTLLDSDANLLLLGDGSLICNNCTYSCSACGDKIEDLAILTGDQAFCAACFRCRNCKRKIENLRYARTSQGIFCMDCHETLMARRKKRSKAAAAAKAREKDRSPMITEKSLPALPPNVIPNNAFSNDRVDPESDTPTELSPRPRMPSRQAESSRGGSSRPDRSPERQNSNSSRPEGLGLPATTYRNNRNSTIISNDSGGRDSEEGFFIPVALDPSPAPSAPSRTASDAAGDPSKRKDYFSPKAGASDRRQDSTSSTPHIAFQEKGRQPSDQEVPHLKHSSRKVSRSSPAVEPEPASRPSPARNQSNSEGFKLQEAPKTRQMMAASRSSSEQSSPPQELAGSPVPARSERDEFPGKLVVDAQKPNENTPPRPSQEMRYPDEEIGAVDPVSKLQKPKRKEVPATRNVNGKSVGPTRAASEDVTAKQPAAAELPAPSQDSYVQPRTAPLPPSASNQQHAKQASVGSKDGQEKHSPKLPRWSSGGDFSLDEDMARILGTDEPSSSLLRRVSNVVRHGRTGSVESIHNAHRASHSRSISETTRTTTSPRWPKTPYDERNGHASHDIVSPLSGASPEDPVQLKRQLTSSQRRVAELERQFDTEKDLKNLNKKLIEKRKTVSVLDTQSEIMIRQIEVLAGYVERAKDMKTPIDPRELEDSALREFVQKLDKLKLSMSEAIEQLHEERDLLVEEKNQAISDRDRALIEFEQLSSKNAQLADMNNDLTHQIQERFKSQLGSEIKSPNGLGIYSHHKATGSSVNLDSSSVNTGPTLVGDDETIVESGPTVVQVRKGQVKKFNWKKGGKSMAQGVSKGLNRAVVAFQNDRERMQQQSLSGDNIGMPYNTTVTAVESPSTPATTAQGPKMQGDPGRQGFGFFGKKHAVPKSTSTQSVQVQAAVEAPSVLFGSDLIERADFERRQIPSIVTRCIEEVELRGMDQEGIYRKSGGSSQINTIKDGFDKDENFDISDPDLDIAAVTSVLKQYFRKLPNPLLTFDIYDQVLESTSIVDEPERCAHLRKTFATMPQSHRDCLEFLMFHLDRVAQRERENLMSPKNLAVVFAPTIMRDLSIEREMTDMHAKNLAVQFVIENSQTIFAEA